MSDSNGTSGPRRPVLPSEVGVGVYAPPRPGADALAAELASALEEISNVRHELNNHLMAALAEVQLLLMDVESEELRESYETIQSALRGMRAAVGSVSHLRQK